MKDVSKEALQLGLKQSGENFLQSVKRKKITKAQYERLQRSITPSLHYQGFPSVDLLIEAVPEDIELKKKLFKEVEGHLRENTLITSNTSSLSVEEMAKALQRPQRFAGLHFFNPVHRMPLVEIITHDRVAPTTIEALYHWALTVKKTPLIVKDGPGFLVNRILAPYMNVPIHLLEAGIKGEDIDKACINFGMPMGPFRLLDEVGLDVAAKVVKILHNALGPRMAPASGIQKIVDYPLLGRKGGKGFYLYDEQGKQESWNHEIEQFFPAKKIAMDETLLPDENFSSHD